MTDPVTSQITAAIGPVRGKLDLLDQRVATVERSHQAHLEDAADDRAELRSVREWMIRSEAVAAANGRLLKALTGGTLLGFVSLVVMLADLITKVKS